MPRTDDEVQRDVVEALIDDVRLDLEDLNVTVADGIVTLNGIVPNTQQRCLAEEVATQIKGVTRVVNKLHQGEVAGPSDEDLAVAVADALARDPVVPADMIKVQVEQRRVHLAGQVDSYLVKGAAEDDARLVRGVHAVINDLAVVPGPRHSDRQIADDVRLGLLRELLLDRSEIVVTVHDGVVTLHGSVPTADLAHRAGDLARRTPGVLDVMNGIYVIG